MGLYIYIYLSIYTGEMTVIPFFLSKLRLAQDSKLEREKTTEFQSGGERKLG